MKKLLHLTALLLCLALLLSACGGRPAEEESAPAARHTSSPRNETPASEPSAAPAPELPVTPAPEVVEVQVHYGETTEIEHVEFSGMSADGQELWKQIFTTNYRTELTLIQPIGVWRDRYYLNNNGTVVCLRLSDGAILWENEDFHGASISGLIDERNGSVYLCGYYGPDFFACDSEGRTLCLYGTVVDGCWWPTDMCWIGPDELEIWYASTDPMQPFYVDVRDFTFRWDFGTEPMDADTQYWANIFISDFVEQFISTYPRDNGSDAELSSFARLFCKINRHDAIVYIDGYETVSLDTVNELCMRFFGRNIKPSEGAQYENDWGMKWKYENGKFWFPAADGEACNRFAVVREYLLLNNGDVTLSFDVYEVPLDEYWQHGIDSALYHLTAAEAEAMAKTGRIVRVGSGTALTTPIEQSGHDGYFLHMLHVDPA